MEDFTFPLFFGTIFGIFTYFSETHILGPLVLHEYKLIQNAHLANQETVCKDHSGVTVQENTFNWLNQETAPTCNCKTLQHNLLVESIICHSSLQHRTYFTAPKVNMHSVIIKMDERQNPCAWL